MCDSNKLRGCWLSHCTGLRVKSPPHFLLPGRSRSLRAPSPAPFRIHPHSPLSRALQGRRHCDIAVCHRHKEKFVVVDVRLRCFLNPRGVFERRRSRQSNTDGQRSDGYPADCRGRRKPATTERLLFSTSAWSRRETTMKSSEVAIEQLFPNSSEDQFLDMTPDGLFEAACN